MAEINAEKSTTIKFQPNRKFMVMQIDFV